MIDGGSATDNRSSLDVASDAALRGDDSAIPNLAMTHDAHLSRENYVVAYIGRAGEADLRRQQRMFANA